MILNLLYKMKMKNLAIIIHQCSIILMQKGEPIYKILASFK